MNVKRIPFLSAVMLMMALLPCSARSQDAHVMEGIAPWAKEAVLSLQNLFIPGRTALFLPDARGKYHGKKSVTRWQLLYVVAGLIDTDPFKSPHPDTTMKGLLAAFAPSTLAPPSNDSPKDVPQDVWSYAWPLQQKAGLLQGDSDGWFRGKERLTRGQLAVVVARLLLRLEKKPPIALERAQFRDVAGDEWWAGDAWIMAGIGLMQGYADHTFRGSQPVTRDELAVTLARLWHLVTQ